MSVPLLIDLPEYRFSPALGAVANGPILKRTEKTSTTYTSDRKDEKYGLTVHLDTTNPSSGGKASIHRDRYVPVSKTR